MSFKAFRFRQDHPEGNMFRYSFLASYDFDQHVRSEICRELRIHSSGNKLELSQRISNTNHENLDRIIIQNLISRTKTAVAFKSISNYSFAKANNPQDLVTQSGKGGWYGPIIRRNDNNATWYIYSKLISYKDKEQDEIATSDEYIDYVIRWLCFARIENNILSLHWHGFTYNNDPINRKRNSQFPYWQYIPNIIQSLENLLGAKTKDIKLHALILDTILGNYRNNPEYNWDDKRIRAEAGGVSLNARAGSSNNDETTNEEELIDLGGISYLAMTIWKAIAHKLDSEHNIKVPNPKDFVDTILLTLIKKYGALSYELKLNSNDKKLFHGHCYFGVKNKSKSPDAFPHIQLKNTGSTDDLSQLNFLLSHFEDNRHL